MKRGAGQGGVGEGFKNERERGEGAEQISGTGGGGGNMSTHELCQFCMFPFPRKKQSKEYLARGRVGIPRQSVIFQNDMSTLVCGVQLHGLACCMQNKDE